MQTGHIFNSTTPLNEKMKIVAREGKESHRKIAEAIQIHLRGATLNRNDGHHIPDAYLPILREEGAGRGDRH